MEEHLAAMDYLRQGIHLRGYAQKDPKQEYKKESFRMFTEMLDSLKHHVITTLTRVKVRTQEEIEEAERARQEMAEREALTHQPVDENTEQAQNETIQIVILDVMSLVLVGQVKNISTVMAVKPDMLS